MPAASSVKLTAEEKQAVEHALQALAPHIVSRGAALMRERAVRSFRWIATGLEAQVQDTRLFKTVIAFVPDGARPSCSCGEGPSCKHTAAVLLELRRHASLETKTPATSSPSTNPPPERQRPKSFPPTQPPSTPAPPPFAVSRASSPATPVTIEVRADLQKHPDSESGTHRLRLSATALFGDAGSQRYWDGTQWPRVKTGANPGHAEPPIAFDRSVMQAATVWLGQLRWVSIPDHAHKVGLPIRGQAGLDNLADWLSRCPPRVSLDLDPDLESLRTGQMTAIQRLELHPDDSHQDWFDVKTFLDLSDATLTTDEIRLLLASPGRWTHLPSRGWQKLDLQISDGIQKDLSDLGFSHRQFTGETHRLHVIQLEELIHGNSSLVTPAQTQKIKRRLDEIQTKVTPPIPTSIQASLRPYQEEGFHFLAYLSSNRFGGILADDMGLGKTLQALTWIAWLRAEQKIQETILVICPKSVQDNWQTEAHRFLPGLKVEVWNRASAGKTGLDGTTDLLVIHYAQLRSHEEALRELKWGAVILDEAQAIKNPTSQSAKAACSLDARHRLALTGTPIENRLLDLWSIFAFAMPGILGTRSSFGRMFDAAEDPLARRRLAARTKPFLLRRTKKEVAQDLPERIEEDLTVELEGTQAALYQAELKRARAQLLKAGTSAELDKLRFNILTSLLRLRQICCNPNLVGLNTDDKASTTGGKKKKKAAEEGESAKLTALIEQLEPILEEGQKVLVFSQFVEMLHLIQKETEAQNWTTFILTGGTEDRGQLVSNFQSHEGSAVFLISLKAGGAGLNLTAASYVILYDPWWNPAVEAQAIDRTHRIGQKQTVFAYRLIAKDTIEEKIRLLQKQKGALALDILGEESFAQGLTLSDFQFLLG